MDYLTKYRIWMEHPSLTPELLEELQQIAGSDEEIFTRFSRELSFGTGGIRGKMGAGTARMNIYIVRRATEGLARYLKSLPHEGSRSVVIAYDTRHNSLNFARETASVLIRHGIIAYLFQKPEPTPLLSFAVRELQASAGVVVTASHNPFADNGYKVYGPDGARSQILWLRPLPGRSNRWKTVWQLKGLTWRQQPNKACCWMSPKR
jgi:phosphoglucomutase